jgi:signal transduction histidine kinase
VKVYINNDDLNTEVEDTGIGIKADDLTKLFKFFGKLHNSSNINKGGMGLGLNISKMII